MIINLTPHPIVIVGGPTFPPSGTVARCEEIVTPSGSHDGVPVVRKAFGQIVNLPAPVADTLYIVSALVASAARRADVVCPGDFVRDSAGKIIGCKSLCRVE